MAIQAKEYGTERALVDAGLVDTLALTAARRRMERVGGTLPGNLVRMALVAESRLLDLLSRHYNVPTVSKDRLASPQEEALDHIAFEQAYQYRVLPLSVGRNGKKAFLELAASDPGLALERITALPGVSTLQLRLCVASEREIERALIRAYEQEAPPFRPLPQLSTLPREEAAVVTPTLEPLEVEVELPPPSPKGKEAPEAKPKTKGAAGPAKASQSKGPPPGEPPEKEEVMKGELEVLEPAAAPSEPPKAAPGIPSKELLAIRVLIELLEEKGVLTKQEFMDALHKAAQEG